MSRRAPTLKQPGLWDDPAPEPLPVLPAARTRPRRVPTHTPQPHRSKDFQAEPCDPACLICGKPEGCGLCHPRCTVVCTHNREPWQAGICLTTLKVTARLVRGTRTVVGHSEHAVVDPCPTCQRLHWHTPQYGLHLRIPPCRVPYLVLLPRPRLTPSGTWEHPDNPETPPVAPTPQASQTAPSRTHSAPEGAPGLPAPDAEKRSQGFEDTLSVGATHYLQHLAEQAICSCPAGAVTCVRQPDQRPGDRCTVCASGCSTVTDFRAGTETTWHHEDPEEWASQNAARQGQEWPQAIEPGVPGVPGTPRAAQAAETISELPTAALDGGR